MTTGGMDGRGGRVTRRAMLGTMGATVLTASTAGCLGLDGDEDTDDDTTPDDTQDDQPVQDDTGDDTPDDDTREELQLPPEADEDAWEEAKNAGGQQFENAVTDDNQLTEYGEQLAITISQDELAELRPDIGESIADRGELDAQDIGIIQSLINDPFYVHPDREGITNISEAFNEYGLERSIAHPELTRIEEEILLLTENPEFELPEDLIPAKNQVRKDGYNHQELEVFNSLGEYLTQPLNWNNPRLHQVQDSQLLQQIKETGEITEEIYENILDHTENGLIQHNDVSTDYSATKDPYGTGFVTDAFTSKNSEEVFDPEKPVLGWYVEFTEDADMEDAMWALEEKNKEYRRNNMQPFYVIGRNNVEPLVGDGNEFDLRDEVAEKTPKNLDKIPLNYMLFGASAAEERSGLWGVWGDRERLDETDVNISYVNTKPSGNRPDIQTERDAMRLAAIAEPFETNVNRNDRPTALHIFRRSDYDTIEEVKDELVDANIAPSDEVDQYVEEYVKPSWTTYFHGNDPDMKHFTKLEIEYMEDSNYGLSDNEDDQRNFFNQIKQPFEVDPDFPLIEAEETPFEETIQY